eukprot:351309-Chlamydomonas_euryale.AAC.13
MMLGRQIDGIWHTSTVVHGEEIFFGCVSRRKGGGRGGRRAWSKQVNTQNSVLRSFLTGLSCTLDVVVVPHWCTHRKFLDLVSEWLHVLVGKGVQFHSMEHWGSSDFQAQSMSGCFRLGVGGPRLHRHIHTACCCAMLYRSMLHWSMLCRSMMYMSMLYWSMLYMSMLHGNMLCRSCYVFPFACLQRRHAAAHPCLSLPDRPAVCACSAGVQRAIPGLTPFGQPLQKVDMGTTRCVACRNLLRVGRVESVLWKYGVGLGCA